MKKKHIKNIAIYQAKNGAIEFRGDFEQETIWGNLNQIADLFGRDKSVISRHIKNIYKTSELDEMATIAKIATVQKEGKRDVMREIEYYNLDVILSVGYRVDSKQATQFRIWATKTLKQHLLQGYTINKKRISENYEKFMQAVADVKALLPVGVSFITELLKLKKKVYAHCQNGHGRAPTLVAAYLVSQGMEVAKAIEFIKSKRTVIHINEEQLEALKEFENSIKA